LEAQKEMEKSLSNLENIDIQSFQNDLISWFRREQRQLPWRKDRDPYKVWVSEIMLQQTRVETVIPYFNRFLEWFPTLDDLATAEEEKVLKAWEGLGYYSRVRNLQSAVKEVREKYNSTVPNNPEDISSLKGVGPYTAGAILSIAYGIPEPAVDGNVMRVLSRILSIWDDIAKPATRKIFEKAVRKLISEDDPSSFNQALMELGALICTPTSPSCLLCPVREHCHGFFEGNQEELPVKSKKGKQRQVHLAAFFLMDQEEKVLIHKRSNTGLLANLWEFPNVEIDFPIQNEKKQLSGLFQDTLGFKIDSITRVGRIDHVFSHLVWNIDVYTGIAVTVPNDQNYKLISMEKLDEYAFPVPYQKMRKLYLNQYSSRKSK
jgi:A/G-specific adenine glycosylase